MERLQEIPDAGDYFDFSVRRFVGTTRRTLRQIPPTEAFKHWDLWVAQALAALAKLHDAGFLHGSLDASALVVNEEGNLRLGALQKVQEILPIEQFNPNNLISPPEQLLYSAFKQAMPFQTAFQALQQANWPMDQIATIFPTIQHSRPNLFGLYEKVQSEPYYNSIGKASDVWMLGWTLLSHYYSMLEWPYVLTTDFYQTRHEAFHDLIEEMVRWNPSDRLSVGEALRLWAPNEVQSPMETAETPAETPTLNDEPVVSAVSPSVAPVVNATAEASVGRRRPYLTLQSHPAGRSKTRRNLRS